MSERASARDIVAIGASAGGIEAVSKLLRALPGDLPAAVIVVLHRSPEHRDHLLAVMQRATSLKVMPPRNGEMLRRGVCYVPFSDQHFTLGQTEKFAFGRMATIARTTLMRCSVHWRSMPPSDP